MPSWRPENWDRARPQALPEPKPRRSRSRLRCRGWKSIGLEPSTTSPIRMRLSPSSRGLWKEPIFPTCFSTDLRAQVIINYFFIEYLSTFWGLIVYSAKLYLIEPLKNIFPADWFLFCKQFSKEYSVLYLYIWINS